MLDFVLGPPTRLVFEEALDGYRSLQSRRPRCNSFVQRLNDIGTQPGQSLCYIKE